MMTSRLRLVRPVNDGRGTNVWLADHLALATRVEVTFAESAAKDPSVVRNELAAQARAFRDRAEVASRVNDPHVVLVLEQGEVSGVPFVVTKALEGKSLRTRLLHGPASLDEVQRVVRDAASTLGKAHSLGIAHGHLRPDCLFSTEVAGDAFLEIAGFGDADTVVSGGGFSGASSQPSAASPADNPYASPEQLLHGTASDVRSDLWSLAVTVYELLTTTLPFEAATPAGVTVAICNAQFAKPSLYRADLPPGIDGWFDTALAKDPARRFRDAAEFVEGFESALAAEVAPIAPPLPDDSLEMDDDDGDEDEKTVKWDMPEDARAITRPPLAARSATVLTQPILQQPILTQPVLPPAPRAPNLAMVSTPGSVSAPPRASAGAVQASAALPPTLEPGVYLDSPYMASVMSALAVPNAAPEGVPARVRRRLFGIDGPLFTPDKTWLAALAFAAGVAVTWFAYDPEPEGEAVGNGEARQDGPIRTVSVDDLPRVEGDEELPRIIQTSQLPRAADDDEAIAPLAGRAAAASERRGVPAQRVQALAAATPKPAAVSATPPRAKGTDGSTSNCNPPYFFDTQGIRRLKSECLNGGSVIQGPYGAVLTTNVSAKTAGAGKGASEKQARASASCTPPYYFDGKIRRLKLECL
jgi:serine/threonine protein kinase